MRDAIQSKPERPVGLFVGRSIRYVLDLVPTVIAFAAVGGLAFAGQKFGWTMPKFSALRGEAVKERDDWCSTHNVAESECVECNDAFVPKGKAYAPCRPHDLPNCPLCHPELAQLPYSVAVGTEDLARAAAALAFVPRQENEGKCKLHERRIQFVSAETVDRLGLRVAPVARASVTESISANGEIGFDPTRVVRLAPRAPGTLWRVEKQVGDAVAAGDVLAIVDAAQVGKAKAEFQQALVHSDLTVQTLAGLNSTYASVVARRAVEQAEAAVAEARVRVFAARQALVNLGFSVKADDYRGFSPADVAKHLQFLGLPDDLARRAAATTSSSNLLAVRAPFAGEIVERSAVPGEAVDPSRLLFVVADTRRMWLTVQVRSEDADRIKPGQPVRFQHDGHECKDVGTVVWVSPAANEKTRTVPVRVDWPNATDRHRAKTFGTAQIVLRQEPYATVVPSEAVHWEGDCHVVFVRDKDFDTSKYKLFHVRKVRLAAKDAIGSSPVTEVIGVLPSELVATTNSGILRSELLKNSIGDGCGCGH